MIIVVVQLALLGGLQMAALGYMWHLLRVQQTALDATARALNAMVPELNASRQLVTRIQGCEDRLDAVNAPKVQY